MGVANEETAGIQSAVGSVAFWRRTGISGYETTVAPRLSRLNIASRTYPDVGEPMVEIDRQVFSRPKLRVGDLVIYEWGTGNCGSHFPERTIECADL